MFLDCSKPKLRTDFATNVDPKLANPGGFPQTLPPGSRQAEATTCGASVNWPGFPFVAVKTSFPNPRCILGSVCRASHTVNNPTVVAKKLQQKVIMIGCTCTLGTIRATCSPPHFRASYRYPK
jgi:hypothetical protein